MRILTQKSDQSETRENGGLRGWKGESLECRDGLLHF